MTDPVSLHLWPDRLGDVADTLDAHRKRALKKRKAADEDAA